EPLNRPPAVRPPHLRLQVQVSQPPGKVPFRLAVLPGQRTLADEPAEGVDSVLELVHLSVVRLAPPGVYPCPTDGRDRALCSFLKSTVVGGCLSSRARLWGALSC